MQGFCSVLLRNASTFMKIRTRIKSRNAVRGTCQILNPLGTIAPRCAVASRFVQLMILRFGACLPAGRAHLHSFAWVLLEHLRIASFLAIS